MSIKQKRLEAVYAANDLVSDIRINLSNASLIQYGDGSDVFEASCRLTEALDAMYEKIKSEPEWNKGTDPAWRTHGTVVVCKPDDSGLYALDPDFKIPGGHYVWLDGGSRWVRLDKDWC